MSQFNFGTIDPNVKTGTELAADLNQWRDALHTTHAGVARPAYATPGMLWVDQTSASDWKLKMATSTGDVLIGGVNPTTNQKSPALFADGSVTAPALAFASEPGLGWYRSGPGLIGTAFAGKPAALLAASATETSLALYPGGPGVGTIQLNSDIAANRSVLQMWINQSEARLKSYALGSGTIRPITYEAPSHNFEGSTFVTNAGGSLGIGVNGGDWRLVKEGTFIRQYFFNSSLHKLQSDQATGIFSIGTSGGDYVFNNDGDTAGKKNAGGWVANSDGRIKERIEDYTAGLDAVLALRPRRFSFRPETGRDSEKRYVGLVAQEAESAMPDLVTSGKDKLGDLEFDDMRTLDITNITYALVNAVKELAQRMPKPEVT
jgi:hypothetical protein